MVCVIVCVVRGIPRGQPMVGALKTKRISRGVDSAGFLDFGVRKITRGFSPLMRGVRMGLGIHVFLRRLLLTLL